jgi:4-hydroxy-4-methyl-2-oxoglutarate aldolase
MSEGTNGALARLAALPTAAVSDALDRAGIPGALHGLAPLANHFRAAGPAFTVRYAPVDSVGDGTVGDFLDEVPPGAVIVMPGQVPHKRPPLASAIQR